MSRGLGDVYKRQVQYGIVIARTARSYVPSVRMGHGNELTVFVSGRKALGHFPYESAFFVRLWWTVVRQMRDFFVGKPIFLCYNN